MPTGKVISPRDPNFAFATLGQVQQTDGTIYAFLNVANLQKDDPVLFRIEAYTISLYGVTCKMSLAVLHGTEKGDVEILKKPWAPAFKEMWDTEWSMEDPAGIERLYLKPFNTKLNVLLGYNSIDNIVTPLLSKD